MAGADILREMLKAQRALQRDMHEVDPGEMMIDDRVMYIKDMVLAMTDELHELLNETGWKPWATSRHVNREAAVGELVDVWHFFMNLMLALNVSPNELFDRYMEKRQRNIQRQQNGYDGVSGKCPKCKRALDDPAVFCTSATCSQV
jgi:dimeric dUTPase (all-alpha-NTP-PPase superfamily)